MSSGNEGYNIIFKLVIIGDASVGKTNILSKYLNNEFDENSKATIGVEFSLKTFEIDHNTVKAQIWDTAGQERYRSITNAYYKGARGALLVYDISRKITFENIDNWVADLKENGESDMTTVLIGNKSDLEDERQVSKEEGELKAKQYGMAFIETSAKNGNNIEKAFVDLVEELYKSNRTKVESEARVINRDDGIDLNKEDVNNNRSKKGCC